METLKPHEIAVHVGVDPKHARGLQDWRPDTHPHLTISELVHGETAEDAVIHAFRIKDNAAGTVHTKIPTEREHFLHPKHVDQVFAETLAMNQKKNLEIMPLVMAAVPELDPESEAHLRVGGAVFDLIDGRMMNRRRLAEFPHFSVSGKDVVVDASDMADCHQTALKQALSGKAKVIAPRARG